MPTKPSSDDQTVFIATETFIANVDGKDYFVRFGDKLRANHPAADAHREWMRLAESTD